MKKVLPVALYLLLLHIFSFGQENCDSIRFWDNSDLFIKYDTIGRHIQMQVSLGEKEFVLEDFDHNHNRIIFGQYDIDPKGILTVDYDIDKTLAFSTQYKESDCELKFLTNIRCNRFIMWRIDGDVLTVEYILRNERPETKKYMLRKRRK